MGQLKWGEVKEMLHPQAGEHKQNMVPVEASEEWQGYCGYHRGDVLAQQLCFQGRTSLHHLGKYFPCKPKETLCVCAGERPEFSPATTLLCLYIN